MKHKYMNNRDNADDSVCICALGERLKKSSSKNSTGHLEMDIHYTHIMQFVSEIRYGSYIDIYMYYKSWLLNASLLCLVPIKHIFREVLFHLRFYRIYLVLHL